MPRLFYALVGSLCMVPAAYAAQPVPDPRLEQVYNNLVVAEIQRSVSFERTLPQPPARSNPPVHEQDMKRVGDNLYVERSLLPRSSAAADEQGVIRVFPRDVR